jgi:plasmid stabilization system protein ParE
MNYSFRLEQEASKEFVEAFVWYGEQQDGLDKLFKLAFDTKLALILKNPYHYKASYKKYHEAFTDKFPFSIVYTIDDKNKEITVIAIFHTSRNLKKKFRKT